MTAKEKRILDRIKIVVEDMMKEKESGTYMDSPIDGLIEEAYQVLNLDNTFNSLEIKILKVAKFRVNNRHDMATRKYKKAKLILYKTGFNTYELTFFGNPRHRHFVDIDDLDELSNKNIEEYYQDYIS